MAKHRAQRALFELLVKKPGQTKPKPVAGTATKPTVGGKTVSSPERAAEPPRCAEPVPITRRLTPAVVTRKATIIVGGVRLTWPYLVIAGVVLVCICYLSYALGTRQAGDGLPSVEKQPTMETIRDTAPVPGLVAPGAKPPKLGVTVPPAPGPRAGGTQPPDGQPAPAPGVGTQPPDGQPAPTEPPYRVRIARIDVAQAGAIDNLRAFLAKSGIQTETVTRSGYHILYSRQRFGDKTKSDDLAIQVNKSLEAFEKETGRPTSKDAYTVKMK